MEYFWHEKSKVLARIKPRFSFWLKINFRKITSNKHVDLRKPRSKGTESATRGVLQEKLFLEISQNSRANICASLFFNKVAGPGLWHRCFPVNFAKFPWTPSLQNISRRLLLKESELISENLQILQNLWWTSTIQRGGKSDIWQW